VTSGARRRAHRPDKTLGRAESPKARRRPARIAPCLAKHTVQRVVAASVSRDEEAAAIGSFLASHGATHCPAAYALPTSTTLSRAEETQRLMSLQLKPGLSRREIWEIWRARLRPR
jgi:hypothetical protein